MSKAHLSRSHNEKVTLALDICEFLNELVNLDRNAVQQLVAQRVPCNEGIVNHPTAQVPMDEELSPCIGLLGVLNGLVGGGYIVAVYDNDNGQLQYFLARLGNEEK
jgi:hypothetical protein